MMPMIQGQMGIIRENVGVFGSSVFVSFAVSLDDTKDEEECLNELLDPATGQIDDDLLKEIAPLVCSYLQSTCPLVIANKRKKHQVLFPFVPTLFEFIKFYIQAELLRMNCTQDLNTLKEAFEDPKLHLPEETQSTADDIDKTSHSLSKESVQKLINALRPKLKQALSDCMRKNKLLFQESGKEGGLKTCYPHYSESLILWCEISRRSLAGQSFAVDSASNLGPLNPILRSSLFS
ncbi:hypothetical protein F3Y22_tig00111540pilonHSYRG00146 [Hibiscus syriacus]|uniref:Uncharacterized protein n=1 Tax=Hibiscus syriacus TaxID=106335 RepID=A0A6A2YE77_HIBSY|nr:hypothetical protein F3Y22_tig00111540pilonHSYRG00146 [Hibiscus syriacus]